MNKSCKHCNHIHAGDDARAIGRFAPGGPLGYKANYEGSPLRTTRKQARQDMCQWRQEQNRKKKWPKHKTSPPHDILRPDTGRGNDPPRLRWVVTQAGGRPHNVTLPATRRAEKSLGHDLT